ncbi:hypothetical protein J3R82DRAFT_6798 [Butyriboletus roseoflavus]|nr:hypothetical protein J3R82DRAFT_6798 [Butyriboletus roseoflavus]
MRTKASDSTKTTVEWDARCCYLQVMAPEWQPHKCARKKPMVSRRSASQLTRTSVTVYKALGLLNSRSGAASLCLSCSAPYRFVSGALALSSRRKGFCSTCGYSLAVSIFFSQVVLAVPPTALSQVLKPFALADRHCPPTSSPPRGYIYPSGPPAFPRFIRAVR